MAIARMSLLGLALGTASLLVPGRASAELWQCTPKAGGSPYFTETPSFGEDVTCEEVRNSRFSKPAAVGSEGREKPKKDKGGKKVKKDKKDKKDKKKEPTAKKVKKAVKKTGT